MKKTCNARISSSWVQLTATLMLVSFSFLSCGKKKDSSSSAASSDPGVQESTDNNLTLSGTLAISSPTLALASAGADGILAFSISSGTVIGEPTKIDVASDGTFSLPMTRKNDAVETMKDQAALPAAQRDWNALLEAAAKVVDLDGMTAEDLKGMDESELQSGIAEVAANLSTAGSMTMLVAYTKSATGDVVAEAESFRFIGMPTSGGQTLSGIPMSDLKGNISFGNISGSGTDVKSQITANDAMNLSTDAIERFAEIGKALKMVKNSYMNQDWGVEPFYVWNATQKPADLLGAYSDASKQSYSGYGFYVRTLSKTDLTFANMCGTKVVTFTPPSAVTSSEGSSHTVTAFDNKSVTTSKQGSSDICSGNGYYARADYQNSVLSGIMLNFGTGGSITTSPEGLWKLAIDGTTVGNYDLALASPVDSDGNPTVLVPSVQFTQSGSNVVSMSVKLYAYKDGAYSEVTDFAPVRALISQMEGSITRASDNGESRVILTLADDNTISGSFDSTRKEDGSVINAPVAVSDVSAFSFAYQIGTSNYRTEWRK